MSDSEGSCILPDEGENEREVDDDNTVKTEDSKMDNPAQTAENSYVCKICDRSFSKKGNFQRHNFTLHTKERPYQCLVCKRRFALKESLKRHNKVHTREKVPSCGICHKTFKSKKYWRKHILLHGKPHTCNICYESFSLRSSLIGHKLLHTDNENLESDNMERQKTSDINPNQLLKIIQFMEDHPDLNDGSAHLEERKDLWQELIENLNQDDLGSKKTISQWRKCWADKRMSVRSKIKQKRVLSAIEKRMVPLLGFAYKLVKNKSPSREIKKEPNSSDQLITGLSVDYENSHELNEQMRNCRENSDHSPKKQNLKNGENSFSDAYAYCSVSYENQSMENQNLENGESSFTNNVYGSSSSINQSTGRQNLENEEHYFIDAHSSNSCISQSAGKISALERIAVAAEKQALAAENQALAMEKQEAALKILAMQSIKQNETLNEIFTIIKKIA